MPLERFADRLERLARGRAKQMAHLRQDALGDLQIEGGSRRADRRRRAADKLADGVETARVQRTAEPGQRLAQLVEQLTERAVEAGRGGYPVAELPQRHRRSARPSRARLSGIEQIR